MSLQQKRRGFTFVELIAAIAVLAIAIVPATQYLTESMTYRRYLERSRALGILAIQTIENQMAVINGGFTTANETGTFASQGFPTVAYQVIRTDAASEGGIPNLLMVIHVRVWSDDDGDLIFDATESDVELHTKMARSIE
ncbi:MAG: prepilin-type N-terminal cleavage/methylation domain-containing protein [Planctomycetes bacterium]|nr:prepilin-type N-terminal cleavage/methylation domain-containing protein [Planctomycetota bacterium]